MSRAFKIQFHNGEKDEKTIVTMAVTVNNGKRFSELDEDGRESLAKNLRGFSNQCKEFAEEILAGHYMKLKKKTKTT